MDKIEMWRLIQKAEKAFKRKKLMRFIYTILFYSVVLFGIMYAQGQVNVASIWDILSSAGISILFSAPGVLLNSVIFNQLYRASEAESKTLENFKKEYEKMK